MDYTYDKQMPKQDPCKMPAISMTYSPKQAWDQVYCAQDGLSRGTIFLELDKPFLRGACSCE